jgi:putative flippase GtrA
MRLPRYLVVGGACALINNALVIALSWRGFDYFMSTWLAFGPVLVLGYAAHTTVTFRMSTSWPAFGRYTLAMLANYPMWLTSLYILCDVFGLSVTISAPIMTGLLFVWNYLSSQWALSETTSNLLMQISRRQPRV